jgi:hypothetical protein
LNFIGASLTVVLSILMQSVTKRQQKEMI